MNDKLPDDTQLEALEQRLETLTQAAENFGDKLTSSLVKAAIQGKDLDDVFRRMALSLANRTLSKALAPVDDLISGFAGNLVNSLAGGLTAGRTGSSVTNVTINTPNAASFQQSRNQVAASLNKALTYGSRAL